MWISCYASDRLNSVDDQMVVKDLSEHLDGHCNDAENRH